MLNLSLGDVMFVSIKNYICKNFVCRMCVRWWVYVSETRFCFSCEVFPVCFVVVSVGSLQTVCEKFGFYIGLSSYYECTCLQYCSDMLL